MRWRVSVRPAAVVNRSFAAMVKVKRSTGSKTLADWATILVMHDEALISELARHRVIPLIVSEDASRAKGLGDALVAGGLPVAEVALRTNAALDIIEQLARNDKLLVGAGTVLSAEAAQQVIDRGARFVVSPGLDESVVNFCRDRDVFALPGVATATELQQALRLGLEVVKFFPAEAIGGVPLLKALAGPFPDVRFVPTGGISADNLANYLALPSVVACGGSWMVRQDWIEAGRFEQITVALESLPHG
jgi:2-dehydro-3-deoxyphosphogluconate aldolase / (4S)-4-hydroxy-2-oxoglutarate aldolase